MSHAFRAAVGRAPASGCEKVHGLAKVGQGLTHPLWVIRRRPGEGVMKGSTDVERQSERGVGPGGGRRPDGG